MTCPRDNPSRDSRGVTVTFPAPSPSLIRRAGVFAGVVALGPAASASVQSDIAKKKPTINTYKGWAQNQTVAPFGCPDSTTYGQTITVPNSKHEIQKFTFYMNDGG